MALLKIAQLGHPAIRAGAGNVILDELARSGTQDLIDSMIETMRDADGVGIAAPQVHVDKRIIVIEVKEDNRRYPGREAVPLTIVINPEISEVSESLETGWEGCLSIPDLRGQVPRHASLKLCGLDRDGRPIEQQARGFFARVIQHEVDHLNGGVYLDRMPDLKSLTFLPEFMRYWL